MKKKRFIRSLLAFLAVVFTVIQAIPAMAGSKTTVSVKESESVRQEEEVALLCSMDNGVQVTNGKLRILYDGEKLKLNSCKEGKSLEKALCEINDCLTGNKQEGEIVLAFASSESIDPEGILAELKFRPAEGVGKDEAFTVEMKVEKLSGDNGEVSAEGKSLTFRLGSGDSGHGGVKTGDTTAIIPVLAAGLVSLLMIAVILAVRRRRQK